MRAGKLAPEQLERLVLGRFQRRRKDILVHAGIGEDCAVIDFGDQVCVVSTDPITGAGIGAGRLAVHVSCNDVAANGAHPVGIQVVLLLPEGADENLITRLMDEVEQACAELDIEVLGGHTEITSKVGDPVIVTTAIGRAAKDAYVTSSGARPGDDVVITKGVGIEGTAILATDWRDVIKQAVQRLEEPPTEQELDALLNRAQGFAGEISAVRDGLLAVAYGVTAMHDVTEGGLYGALWEMSRAAQVGFVVERDKVPVRPETRFICDCLRIDPLGLISSGTMLITCPDGAGLATHLRAADIPAFVIGRVTKGESGLKRLDGSVTPLYPLREDELWRFLASVGDAVAP
ncbi:MAG TPA: AIR synthase [Firmicutes bacterium]|nr:AIR synthase [Bacillota bacterium]